jgi:hypothetical protein
MRVNSISIVARRHRKRQSLSGYWTPRSVTGLTAIVYNDVQINLTWTNNGTLDYTGHKVYISTDGITYSLSKTIASIGTSTSIISLTAGTTYYFYILPYKLLLLGNASNIVSCRISTLLTGLLEYWKLDESSGNATGVYGTVLTNNGTAQYGTGDLGNCIDFGATNTNKSLSVDSVLGLNYASSKSIICRIKINTAPGTGVSLSLLSMMFATNPGNYIALYYTELSGTRYLHVNTGVKYAITLTTGVWYKVCITWDQAGNEVKIYLNGDLVLTDIAFTYDYSTYTNRIAIGKFLTVNTATAAIDEFGIYNRILTLADAKEVCNNAPFATIGTLGDIAYCWFARPRALYDVSLNKTWIGIQYNDGMGYTQHILIVDNATGVIVRSKIGTVVQYDDHNEPTFLIRVSDSRLFTCYTEHATVGSPIRYRLSTNPLDATAWGAESTKDPDNPNTYTYPSCFQVANGDIYIFYRNTDNTYARWCYIKSTDGGINFGAQVQFGADSGTGPTYCNIVQNQSNKNIIHFIGSAHPNEALATNYVIHFYFDAGAGTWHKSDGMNITALLPIGYIEATAIDTKTASEQLWIEDIFLDTNGYPRVLMTYYPDEVAHFEHKYLYYSEWTGLVWSTPYELHESLNRNIALANIRGEISYPPLACFDRGNANRIFASKDISGKCEIFELTRVAANNFTSVQKTIGSFYDQWRPFTTNAATRNVFWLNKTRYYSYLNDFSQKLMNDTF